MRDSLRVVLLSSFTCVILQFPFFIVLLMEMFCQSNSSNPVPCGQSETTWAVVALITMLKPGIMPLTWLAYTDIRNGIKFESLYLCLGGRRRRGRGRQVQDDFDTSVRALTWPN